jgi:hypothetical protein
MSKDFRALLDDAQARVNFFVNVWFFSLVFTAVAGVRFLLRCYEALPDNYATLIASWGYLAASASGLTVTWLVYETAVEHARAWGDLVRSAFDLFLPELAKKMGYQLPSDPKERRRFWQDVTSSFLYNMPLSRTWPFAAEPTSWAGVETLLRENNDTESGESDDANLDEAC